MSLPNMTPEATRHPIPSSAPLWVKQMADLLDQGERQAAAGCELAQQSAALFAAARLKFETARILLLSNAPLGDS